MTRHRLTTVSNRDRDEARRKMTNAISIRAEGALYGYRTLDGTVRAVVPRGVRLRVLRSGLWKRELVRDAVALTRWPIT